MKFKELVEVFVAGYKYNDPEIIKQDPKYANDVAYRFKQDIRNNNHDYKIKHFEENGKWYVIVMNKEETNELFRRQFPTEKEAKEYIKSELNL
jgi:hypothetical protein